MFHFKQFLAKSLNESSQSSSHYLLRKHKWELSKTQDVGSHAVKYTHPNLPNHEIHVSKNNFIHQDKSRDKDIAYGTHDDLQTHLKKLHEEFEKIISTNDIIPSSQQTPKNEDYGDPADFRLTSKSWGDSYNPFPMHDTDDTDNDKKTEVEDVMIDQKKMKKEFAKTPNDYSPNDYSPRVAVGQNVMPEAFGDPTSHPFHSTAIKSGFTHTGSTSMLGAATHNYSHPSSATPLQLKTTSNNTPSWIHGSSSGTNTSSLSFHAAGMKESIKITNHKDHPLHPTIQSLGYEHASDAHSPYMGTQHLYVHKNPKVPTVTLHSPGDAFTVNTAKPVKGGGIKGIKQAIGKHMVDEGIFSSIFSKPKPVKITLPYKTDHDYGRGYDIEPSTVPVFKPSWQSKGSDNSSKEK